MIEPKINIDNVIELSIVANETEFGYLKHGNIKVNNATLVSMVKTKDNKFDIELEVSKTINIQSSVLDYQGKYNELCKAVQEQLKVLKPWYVGGSVMNPMGSIEALKNIDRLVKL